LAKPRQTNAKSSPIFVFTIGFYGTRNRRHPRHRLKTAQNWRFMIQESSPIGRVNRGFGNTDHCMRNCTTVNHGHYTVAIGWPWSTMFKQCFSQPWLNNAWTMFYPTIIKKLAHQSYFVFNKELSSFILPFWKVQHQAFVWWTNRVQLGLN